MHASGGQPLKKACPSFCIDLRTSRPSGSCHSDPFQRRWWWWCSRSRWQIVHVPRCLRRRWPKFPHEVLETCTVLRSGKQGRWSLGLRGWSLGLRGWRKFRTNHALWISLGNCRNRGIRRCLCRDRGIRRRSCCAWIMCRCPFFLSCPIEPVLTTIHGPQWHILEQAHV